MLSNDLEHIDFLFDGKLQVLASVDALDVVEQSFKVIVADLFGLMRWVQQVHKVELKYASLRQPGHSIVCEWCIVERLVTEARLEALAIANAIHCAVNELLGLDFLQILVRQLQQRQCDVTL